MTSVGERRRRYAERLKRLSEPQLELLAARMRDTGNAGAERRRTDRLIGYIVPEENRDLDTDVLRDYLRKHLPDYMVPSVLQPLVALPRTHAGKIDRAALEGLLDDDTTADSDGEFRAPSNDIESALAEIWADVLDIDDVSIDDNFFELGGDSLLSIRILARASRAGIRIKPDKFFAHPTIAEQATFADSEGAVRAEQGLVTGYAPITPIQRWFFDSVTNNPQQWNQGALYSLARPVSRTDLEHAVHRLLQHHDALRTVFVENDDERVQTFAPPPAELPVDQLEVPGDDAANLEVAISDYARDTHEGFDLGTGPLIRFCLIGAPGADGDHLLVIAHHLVIDAMSWRILVEDLSSLLDAVSSDQPITLPDKTTALKSWSTRLVDYAESDTVHSELDYWLRAAQGIAIPLDYAPDPDENVESSAFIVSAQLDTHDTQQLLSDVPTAFRTRINDVLLTALAMTLSRWLNKSAVRVDVEGHGRYALFEDMDLSRTVGWLTAHFPVTLRVDQPDSPVDVLASVKQQLRTVPTDGIGHGLLKYVRGEPALVSAPSSDVLFNYLGRLDGDSSGSGLLKPATGDVGPARSGQQKRSYLLEINCRVEDGRFICDWSASNRFHHRDTVSALSQQYMDCLKQIAAAAGAGFTADSAADFPLADLDDGDMARLSELLANGDDDG